MADQNDVDLDSIIDRLLEVRGSRPGKQVQLLEAEIRHLCQKAREIFISQPILLELEAPIKASHNPFPCQQLKLWDCANIVPCLVRFAVIFTASTTISYAYSNTEDSHPRRTISSLATMLIGESNPLRPFVCSWHTRSNIPRISSFCVATTNALRSIAYTGSMMNAREGTISSYGRPSPTASIACQSQQSLTRRFSRCMEG